MHLMSVCLTLDEQPASWGEQGLNIEDSVPESLNSPYPSFRDFITVGLNIILMGTGYIFIPVIAGIEHHPPPVGKITFNEYQVILKVGNPYMILYKPS